MAKEQVDMVIIAQSIWGQSKLQPDIKGTDSLGCNVMPTDHGIAAVLYAGGCCDDFSNQRHV